MLSERRYFKSQGRKMFRSSEIPDGLCSSNLTCLCFYFLTLDLSHYVKAEKGQEKFSPGPLLYLQLWLEHFDKEKVGGNLVFDAAVTSSFPCHYCDSCHGRLWRFESWED